MKNKVLYFFGVLSVALGAFLVFSTNKSENTDQLVTPDLTTKEKSMKGAFEFIQMMKGDLRTGEIDYNLASKAYEQANKLKSKRAGSLNLSWETRGPDNIGGRARALVIDNENNSILYSGGVSGGIFKSTNGGKTWKRKSYEAEIGGLVISFMTQTIDGTLLASTGEMFFTAMSGPNGNLVSGSRGGGIYRSTDRGESWSLLSSTNPDFVQWTNVQKVVASPVDANKVFAASYRGLYVSKDKGDTWDRINTPAPSSNHAFIDVVISPDGQTVYAASYSSSRCALYRSKDAGETFVKVANDINDITNATRVTIAIAEKDPNYVYVATASNGTDDGTNGTHSFGGLFRTMDNGDNWELVIDGGTDAEPFGRSGRYQGQYDNCVAVDPDNVNRVFVGGVGFYSWNNGQWYQFASLSEFLDQEEKFPDPRYVHADKHNIFFDTKSTPKKMYVVHDGGISVSTDFSKEKYPTFSTININFITTQFYAIGVSKYGDIIGGTQDNGSLRIEIDGLTGNSGQELLGGDGFYSEISKFDPEIYFTESQYGALYRSKNKGEDQEKLVDYENSAEYENNFHFNTPYRIWERMFDTTMFIRDFVVEDSLGNPVDTIEREVDTTIHLSKMYLSSKTGVRVTLDAVDFTIDTIKWYEVSPSITQQIVSLEYAKGGDVVFVGTRSFTTGRIYRISGLQSATYKFDINGDFDPDAAGIKTELLASFNNRIVAGIGVSPSNNNTVVVTLGNYVNNLDHVYISNNALDSAHLVNFNSIQGDLPEMPVYDAVINSQSSNQDTIIIATELGIYATNDGGVTWTEENNGDMERAPVFMLRQQKLYPWHKGYVIYAASHGMGILQSTTLVPNVSAPEKPEKEFEYSLVAYPNPASDFSNLFFELDRNAIVKGQIYNMRGQAVMDIPEINGKTGENRYTLNTSGLLTGNYIIRLYSDDFSMVTKILVAN